MKTTTSILLRAAVICAGIFAMSASANAQQCPAMPKLKIDFHTLDFTEPKPVCVRRNGFFGIKLKALGDYQLDYSKVSVEQKSGIEQITKDDLVGNDVMLVKVGNFTAGGPDPGYKIHVDGVGTLDPRVRIIPSYIAFAPNHVAAEDYMLEDYGLSISGLQELDQYLRENFQTSVVDMLKANRDDSTASE
ncbi:MAG: hypothetical protein OEW68_10260 [Gammaproteobacteria bacterium]|nr:hypothetical protein [Gammaproteobacteria bacterium]MDH4315210.1 hypothetical protein [Gammaproteobacteria bacterium]MDH5214421.1 hypothetical protein [Gammaproteobacteria bacterium]